MTQFPIHPSHPERICWGCDKFCPADDMRCGNGTIRALHPVELMGDDWLEWLQRSEAGSAQAGSDSCTLAQPRGA
ncbi:MAG TPA: DUF3079 domain-containing protein [Verrucomicrobiae bacterium]|nr:DUF3079 domain-containing protein [Verrucomicrobiae bacterium]